MVAVVAVVAAEAVIGTVVAVVAVVAVEAVIGTAITIAIGGVLCL